MKYFTLALLALCLSFSSFGTVAPITGITSLCKNQTTYLADSTTGGTWSTTDTAVIMLSVFGAATGLNAGTATVTYTVGSEFVTTLVTIMPLPPPIIGNSIACPMNAYLCQGDTLTVHNTLAGAWAGDGSGVLNFIDWGPTYLTMTSASSTAYSSNIYFSDPDGHCAIPMYVFFIRPITGDSVLYVGDTTTLHATAAGGCHNWSSSDTNVAVIDSITGQVTGKAPGYTTITYTLGCTETFLLTVLLPTGVASVSAANESAIAVSPNPASDNITITATQNIEHIAIPHQIILPLQLLKILSI